MPSHVEFPDASASPEVANTVPPPFQLSNPKRRPAR